MSQAISAVFVTLVSEGQQTQPVSNHLYAINATLGVVTEVIDATTVDKLTLRGRTRMVVILLNGLTEDRLKDVYPEVHTSLKNSMLCLSGRFIESPTHQLLGVQQPILPVTEGVE